MSSERISISRLGMTALALVITMGLLVGLHAAAEPPASAPPAALAFSYDDTAGGAAAQANPDVVWTASNLTFQSNYPNGFEFSATITSSAGPVVGGRVIWSHAPNRQRSRPIEIDPQTGTLKVVWESNTSERVPPWVGLTYFWRVTDSEGNAFETEPIYAEYEDHSHEWIRSESEDIIVFSQDLPEDVNDMVIAAMAQQRETYRAAWGELLPYKPRAILFGDRGAWYEWRVGLVDAAVIGQTSDDWGGTAQVGNFAGLNDLAYGTVLHEVAHLYQGSFTLMVGCTWITEGNATFFELNQQYDYKGRIQAVAAQGDLPNLLDGSGPGTCGQNRRFGYDIGYTFWAWLVENYGLEGHRQLVELLDTGMVRNQAIEQVTGLSAQEVESRWRVWLGASPVAPTLVPTPTIYQLPSPTPWTFGQN
jgi:hypothetical protein